MVERTLRSGALDGVAIILSGLCLVHCVASAVAVAVLATAGGMLFDPLIHEVGLALAILLGLVALGWGYREHGRVLPVMVGAMGVPFDRADASRMIASPVSQA